MRILIQDNSGVRQLEQGFALEEELQAFLRDYPGLLPLDEVDAAPAPLLCIGWEVQVSSGAEDILFIDASGRLTLIETKLRRNPESRREVLGQILEYAADMASWSRNDIEQRAQVFFTSNKCQPRFVGKTLPQVLDALGQDDASWAVDYEDFMSGVQDRIDKGQFRLLIAVDDPAPALVRTVEFVNRFSQHFEIFLVQLSRFHDPKTSQNIFVPALFGSVGTSKPPVRPRVRWTEDDFLGHARATNDSVTFAYIQRIYEAFKEWTDEQLFGSGSTTASFHLIGYLPGERRATFAQITSRGDLYVHFGNLHLRGQLGREAGQRLYTDLSAIQGVRFPEDVANRYPPIPKSVLKDSHRLELVLDALKRALDEARAANDQAV